MTKAEKAELEKFRAAIRFLIGCCMKHGHELAGKDIVELVAWIGSVPDEESGYALFRMKDKRWGVLIEGQDYTGHG